METMPKHTCYLETLTGEGRAAIAVVRLSGAGCEVLLERCFRPASALPFRIGQIRYGHWDDPHGESIVVTPLTGPIDAVSNAQGPMAFEIHCHGGRAATAAIAESLQRAAVENGMALEPFPVQDDDLSIAKRVAARCLTEKTTAYALAQVRGAFRDWIAAFERRSGSDKDPIDTTTGIDGFRPHDVLRWSERIGVRLTEPLEVGLLGVPNVGKSTLINAILGYERAITMDMPGTTRDVVRGETAIDGWPITFADTAGVRMTDDAIEREGVRRAITTAEAADLVLLIGGPEGIPDAPRHDRIVKVWNKSDRAPPPDEGWIATVATTGENLDALMTAIVGSLVSDLAPIESQPPLALDTSQLKRLRDLVDPTNRA